jgi:hypothetical protein
MMRLVRSAGLPPAFTLLTSAATAHAECAWVLWIDTEPTAVTPEQGRSRVPKWTPASATKTKEACDKARAERRFPDWYVCLPDTVDPRAANAK